MQRIAIFSDVHSNIEALEAVLDDIEQASIVELWCLGDIVGNGHDPVGCLDAVEQRCSVVLAGNHEVVIASGTHNGAPLPHAAEYSRQALLEAGGARLDRMSRRASELWMDEIRLAHGCPSPFDPLRDYIVENIAPERVFEACEEATVLVGHTHVAHIWRSGARQVANVGSVGEPRDNNGRASWVELVREDGVDRLTHHRVDFDQERYVANMAKAGLSLPPMWRPEPLPGAR